VIEIGIQRAGDRAPHGAFGEALCIGEGTYRWPGDAKGAADRQDLLTGLEPSANFLVLGQAPGAALE
jgi:hypothetical protein